MSLSRSEPLQPGRVVDTVAIDPLKQWLRSPGARQRAISVGRAAGATPRLGTISIPPPPRLGG
jgi:hypothetical protein